MIPHVEAPYRGGGALQGLLEKTNENRRKRTIQSAFVLTSWLKARQFP